MRFISPKTDFAFKKIFGSPDSKDILISFLNALIYNGESTIEDLEILDPYQIPQVIGLKDTYLDVKAKLKDGSLVIIEMQVLNVESFGKRVLYNASKAYSLQLDAGQGYWALKPVIALTITDFIMFPKTEKFINHFAFKELEANFIYPENHLDLIFVELPKFKATIEQIKSLTDKWIYFMKNADHIEIIPENMDEIPEFHKAFNIASRANLSREELEDLQKRELFILDQQAFMIKSKKEGLAEGRAEGLAKGRAEGLAEGLAEGKEEKAKEIARQLLGILDEQTISNTTGLSLEEIRSLSSL